MNMQARLTLAIALVPLFLIGAQASEVGKCTAAKGTLLIGTVVEAAKFFPGKEKLQGVSLSHTHVRLRPDHQAGIFDVAMDNVFAADFDPAASDGPASLMALKEGDRLELCGQIYPAPEKGIHWVHTNCGAVPTAKAPNGWVALLNQNGRPGPNLESSTGYCKLWPEKRKQH